MRKNVVHVAFAIVTSSYLIWSSVNAEESPSVTQSPDAMEGGTSKSFLSSVSDSHFEKDFSASVGVKMWMNQWSLPGTVSPEDNGQKLIMSFTSGTEITPIPVFSIRTKNWFVSGSYFNKTEYGFATQSRDVPSGLSFYIPMKDSPDTHMEIGHPAAVIFPVDMSVNNDRTEWDINAGYYLHKYLLVTAGYKKIERDYNLTGKIPDLSMTVVNEGDGSKTTINLSEIPGVKLEQKFETTSESSGPTLGIASVVPLQGRFGLYGNFAFGRLDTTVEGNETNRTTDYYLGEMGLLYSFKIAKGIDAATVSLGYRFQSLYYEADNGLDVTDGTEGFALTLTATF